MDSPGYKTLGSYTITAAGNYGHATGAELTGLEGMERLTLLLSFAYGSGGTSGVVYLQTSLDQANEGGVAGGTWIDIAAMSFTTSSKSRVYNFSARTPVTAFAPADGTLTSDTQIDGVLGDRLRLKIVTLGTYAGGSIVSGRAIVG